MILLALAAATICLDPDERTPSGQRDLASGVTCSRRGPGTPAARAKPFVSSTPAGPTHLNLAPKPLAALRQRVIAAVDLQLIDGTAARYRWAKPMKGAYCGMVNSKNRLGNYVGFSPFVAYMTDDLRVRRITLWKDDVKKGESSLDNDLLAAACREMILHPEGLD